MILGTARSGTTFLGKLFDSHPEVIYRHEPDSVEINRSIPFMPDVSGISKYLPEAEAYFDKLKHNHALKTAGRPPFFRKHYRTPLGEFLFRSAVIAKVAWEKCGLYGSRHLLISDRMQHNHVPAYYVLKSVNSLCRMALFANAVPTCRFVHLIRHPCGVIASRIRGQQENAMSAKTFLKSLFQLPEAKLYPYTLAEMAARTFEEQVAYDWMVKNDKVARDMRNSDCYYPVSYEKLCEAEALESVLQELFLYAKLRWHPQTEQFIHRLQHISGTKRTSYFGVLRNPAGGQHGWKRDLTPAQVQRISAIVAHAKTSIVRGVLE